MHCSTSRVAAEYGSQGQAGVPLDPSKKGFRALKGRNILSPASRALLFRGTFPRVTLATLAHPGLPSAAASRLVNACIRVDSLFSSRSQIRATNKALQLTALLACFSSSPFLFT